jgi:hypothetical protein
MAGVRTRVDARKDADLVRITILAIAVLLASIPPRAPTKRTEVDAASAVVW